MVFFSNCFSISKYRCAPCCKQPEYLSQAITSTGVKPVFKLQKTYLEKKFIWQSWYKCCSRHCESCLFFFCSCKHRFVESILRQTPKPLSVHLANAMTECANNGLPVPENPNALHIIMVISKCYFSGELIALSYKKKRKKQQQQRCEHRIMKNIQIKSTVHDANKKMK